MSPRPHSPTLRYLYYIYLLIVLSGVPERHRKSALSLNYSKVVKSRSDGGNNFLVVVVVGRFPTKLPLGVYLWYPLSTVGTSNK